MSPIQTFVTSADVSISTSADVSRQGMEGQLRANESLPPVQRGVSHVHWFLLIGAEDFEGGKTLDAVLLSDAFVIITIYV